jgi:uncharacterized protein with ParB-like and HNH nuclease domain
MEKLILKSINDILALSDKFYIPSYQRGYRWGKDQAIDLLNDIWNFRQSNQSSDKEVFYCLQPVVVSKNDHGLELIDGQQRITTILIIMQCLKKQMDALDKTPYKICYETREDSELFLGNLNQNSLVKRNDNVDYYHICEVYDAITEWFSGRDGTDKLNFLNTLLSPDSNGKNVKVIWYDVTDENTDGKLAIDIFTRLNIGKIPLTNAELIKALFLIKSNFEGQATLKQIQIASEWDLMEKKLQDDRFWYFIYNSTNTVKYETRIEYIFDLLVKKSKGKEEYYTFNEIAKELQTVKEQGVKVPIDGVWLKLKNYFLSLEEWYENHTLYHLIGFLIECDSNVINKLIEDCKALTKEDFIKHLKELISLKLQTVDIDKLDYKDDSADNIRKVLLLFNIQSILSSKEEYNRFPFNKYKSENWDKEHINSQTDKTTDSKGIKVLSLDLIEYFTGVQGFSERKIEINGIIRTEAEHQKEVVSKMKKSDNKKEFCEKLIYVLENPNTPNSFFDLLYEDIKKEFKENDLTNTDSISNIALLDEHTNRSYGNAIFAIKRKRIIENDRNGVFVPICTKNVFLKYYSKQMKDVMYWQQSDADAYLSAIRESLREYLPNN